MSRLTVGLLLVSLTHAAAVTAARANEPVSGFLNWRGEHQNGAVEASELPQQAIVEGEGANLLWSIDLPGRGTPVIARYTDGDRLFVVGYTGEGPELLEVIVCLDPATGEEKWRRAYADFISDIIYNRYSIGAPTIDPETGNVYFMTSPGLAIALDKDGNELWQISMMETYGRLTFPNGRTGVIAIDGDLAIVNAITSNWGAEGPARNRFYAFDKLTGELVWSSNPGVGPPYLKDSSFSTPVFETRDGVRLFYAGLGDGNLVGVNALTGQPLWRLQMSKGGVNSSPVVWPGPDGELGNGDDLVVELHGQENISDTGAGYMIAVKASDALDAGLTTDKQPAVVTLDDAVWRNDDVAMFTSSPTLVGDTVYQCTTAGFLIAIDVATGETKWKEKLGGDQLHASPLFADGRLYAPFWNDGLFIVTPTDDKPTVEHTPLAGQCIGSPAVFEGKLYVHTTDKLYCFGTNADDGVIATVETPKPDTGDAAALRVVPAEFLLRPGDTQPLRVVSIDGIGHVVSDDVADASGAKWVPPTALVKVELSGDLDDQTFIAAKDGQPSAGALRFESGGLAGTTRGRVLSTPPFSENFDGYDLSETDKGDNGAFAHPPLPWIGARMKWQVRELDGEKVLAKTLDNVLFQRSTVFMGHPDDHDYTVTADVMTGGNRRLMGVVGVVNQRYIIALDGNKQAVEVSSNHDRIKQQASFSIQPDTWYRLTTRVTVKPDGSGIVHAKAWPRDEAEPDAWTLEAIVPNAHTHGSSGLFGFSPQSRFKVYIDNVSVTPNPPAATKIEPLGD